MRKPKFQAPTGMHDILPKDQKYFKKIYNVVDKIVAFYGFEKIDTPTLEQAELFSKGIGLTTEIIEKQMYVLRTKGKDLLALRPEGTASVIRAYIEQGMASLPSPIKLWYFGPFFRYERPQAGRYRQFHQFGLEILGEKSSAADAQLIQIFFNILKELKIKNLLVEINSIGDSQCRPYYKKLLVSYFRSRQQSLCADCRRRIRENPFRILDCKEEKCRRIKAQAPQIIDHLCQECNTHFREVLEFLDELEIPYNLNPYLVRGLDYYTKTVFEISSRAEDTFLSNNKDYNEKKNLGALVGGGRYDALIKTLGGKEAPACGGAAGIERIIELMKEKDSKKEKDAAIAKIYLAQLGGLAKRKSLKLFEEFRKNKIRVAESFGRDSLKAQLKTADKLGVKYTLILGQKEAIERTIIVRRMDTGKQEIVKLDKIVEVMKRKLRK